MRSRVRNSRSFLNMQCNRSELVVHPAKTGKHVIMSTEIVPLYRFWQPRYWPLWCGVAVLRLIVCLPQSARMSVGRFLGRLVMRVAGDRRQVASRNLELCFPELDAAARNDLVQKHFESIGMGIIELGMAWWCSDAYMDSIVTLKGIEHLRAALDKDHGVIMLSGHFAATEISGRPMKALLPPMAAMYRPSNNPLTDQIMRRCRGRSTAELISKTGIRQLLRVLKANRPVWYAADQAYNRKGTVLVPFFNEPATTNTAISQISKVSKTSVVPFFPFRMDNGKSYTIDILPPLEDFPSGDDAADALRINQILEEQIRKAPEQYYWVHRRFKGRPEGYPDPYT
jgi:KDO2-lipid IV(A) lauroyltransferase